MVMRFNVTHAHIRKLEEFEEVEIGEERRGGSKQHGHFQYIIYKTCWKERTRRGHGVWKETTWRQVKWKKIRAHNNNWMIIHDESILP